MDHPKHGLYKLLYNRIKTSNDAGYYFETLWIAYAMIEDRINSVLDKTGGNAERMIKKKLEYLRRRKNVHVRAQFPEEFISRIEDWVKQRNALAHEMANSHKPWSALNKKAALLALNAPTLVNEIAGAVTRVKKQLKKQTK